MRFSALFAAFVLAFFVVAPAQAGTKVLIVASSYEASGNPQLALDNPTADALLMQAALRRTSVDDVTILNDPSVSEWDEGFNTFADSLDDDDIALFYYAGHGFQVDGVNYFLTSDGLSLISLDSLLQTLTQRARGTIVVVDACRNNPYSYADQASELRMVEVTGGTRQLVALSVDDLSNAGNGLAQLGNLRGLSAVVFFSTEPGNVAEDGDTPGLGSPFAKVFSQQVARRQSLDEVFRRTAVEVNGATGGRQSPWRQGDLPFNVFVAGMRALPIP